MNAVSLHFLRRSQIVSRKNKGRIVKKAFPCFNAGEGHLVAFTLWEHIESATAWKLPLRHLIRWKGCVEWFFPQMKCVLHNLCHLSGATLRVIVRWILFLLYTISFPVWFISLDSYIVHLLQHIQNAILRRHSFWWQPSYPQFEERKAIHAPCSAWRTYVF